MHGQANASRPQFQKLLSSAHHSDSSGFARSPALSFSRVAAVQIWITRQPLMVQPAARVGSSRLVACDFRTCSNFCWEKTVQQGQDERPPN